MPDEEWEYRVEENVDSTGVRLEFNRVGPDGVESFVTAMPPGKALGLAEGIRAKALEIIDVDGR
jgi:hypothetical protein